MHCTVLCCHFSDLTVTRGVLKQLLRLPYREGTGNLTVTRGVLKHDVPAETIQTDEI